VPQRHRGTGACRKQRNGDEEFEPLEHGRSLITDGHR
jgi:hypothetical protein